MHAAHAAAHAAAQLSKHACLLSMGACPCQPSRPLMQTLIQSSNRTHSMWIHSQQPTLGLRPSARAALPRTHGTPALACHPAACMHALPPPSDANTNSVFKPNPYRVESLTTTNTWTEGWQPHASSPPASYCRARPHTSHSLPCPYAPPSLLVLPTFPPNAPSSAPAAPHTAGVGEALCRAPVPVWKPRAEERAGAHHRGHPRLHGGGGLQHVG